MKEVTLRFATNVGEYTRTIRGVLTCDFIEGRSVIQTPRVTYHFFDRFVYSVEQS